MPKVPKSILGIAMACLCVMAQLLSAADASAATSSVVRYSKPCSHLSLSADYGQYWVQSEISYQGTDCGDQSAAIFINAILWQCNSAGASCTNFAQYNESANVGSYDFFDVRFSQVTQSPSYTYKYCVSLRNDELERYDGVCTGLVGG